MNCKGVRFVVAKSSKKFWTKLKLTDEVYYGSKTYIERVEVVNKELMLVSFEYEDIIGVVD